MNNETRKKIEEAKRKLLSIRDQVASLAEQVTTLKDEEQEKKDNLPESLSESETAEKMDAAITALDQAGDNLANVDTELDESISNLETATQ